MADDVSILDQVLASAAELQVAAQWCDAMTVSFRNVDADPGDDVQTWPYEASVTVIDRGLVPDWQPVFSEIRRSPWGPVARRVERYLAYREPDPVGTLFRLAIDRARSQTERIAAP